MTNSLHNSNLSRVGAVGAVRRASSDDLRGILEEVPIRLSLAADPRIANELFDPCLPAICDDHNVVSYH